MGIFNFWKSIKPSKARLKFLREQLDAGKILSVNDNKDNKQILNEANYNDSQ